MKKIVEAADVEFIDFNQAADQLTQKTSQNTKRRVKDMHIHDLVYQYIIDSNFITFPDDQWTEWFSIYRTGFKFGRNMRIMFAEPDFNDAIRRYQTENIEPPMEAPDKEQSLQDVVDILASEDFRICLDDLKGRSEINVKIYNLDTLSLFFQEPRLLRVYANLSRPNINISQSKYLGDHISHLPTARELFGDQDEPVIRDYARLRRSIKESKFEGIAKILYKRLVAYHPEITEENLTIQYQVDEGDVD